MRRSCILMVLCFTVLFSSCAANTVQVTRRDIAEAYAAAGFDVHSHFYEEPVDEGEIGYIQATHPNGDYIYFAYFLSADAALAWKEAHYHPVMLGLFSAIYGDPSWLHWQVYDQMVIEYSNPDFYDIFRELIADK